jgi:hypothetical protein
MSDIDMVVAAYKRSAANLLRDPDSVEDLSNQFTLLVGRGERTPIHLAMAQRCANLAPREFIAVFNLASAQMRAGLYEECIRTFIKALNLAPDDHYRGETLHHLGLAWHDVGNYNSAMAWYKLAKEKKPNDKELKHSIAICRLQTGHLNEGLYEFEVTHRTPPRKAIAESGVPFWRGEDLAGKTIIVGHEQGFGDTLQFIRFVPELRKQGARIILSAPPVLSGLLSDCFDYDEVVGEAGPFHADYYTAPLPMAACLGIEYGRFNSATYMRSEPIPLPPRGKLKVGLAWRGNHDYRRDADRSMRLEDLGPLLDLPGAAFYSLDRDSSPITKLGLDGLIADLGSLIHDWRGAARCIAAMDVIVCVDTANGHLAGAMGKPVKLVLPRAACWRWLDSERADTPWYANTRLFRQTTACDWETPVLAVRDDLEQMINANRRIRAA